MTYAAEVGILAFLGAFIGYSVWQSRPKWRICWKCQASYIRDASSAKDRNRFCCEFCNRYYLGEL